MNFNPPTLTTGTPLTPPAATEAATFGVLDVFHSYVWVLLVAFLVTLCATPIMRRLAVKHGIIDRPSEARKIHKMPIAYLGGVAVFLGIVAGIFFSYIGYYFPNLLDDKGNTALDTLGSKQPVPLSVLFGMTVIAVVGLIDDVVGTTPRVKIGGQLLAAAALAADDVGVKVAAGILVPLARSFNIPIEMHLGAETVMLHIPLPMAIAGMQSIPIDIVYWAGTAVIGFFVIGACNASNLIDGLDGLLSGVTAIANAGLLVIAMFLAIMSDGERDAQRVVLCMSILGACLGFLPHNFNPASIFLGDCGSLLLGFCTIVVVLSLGDTGKTHLVMAGLVIYAIPMIDTALAIVRRKMAGKSISDPDSDHLHHMLKRAAGVKGAAFSLYGLGAAFATLGVLMSLWRARVTYALTLIFVSYIAVISIKIARKKQIEEQAAAFDQAKTGAASPVVQAAVSSAPQQPAGA